MLQLTQVYMQEKIFEAIASISPDYLWGIFALILFVFLIISFVFEYHWNHYGVNKNIKRVAQSFFWIVSIILILVMTFALFTFDSQI